MFFYLSVIQLVGPGRDTTYMYTSLFQYVPLKILKCFSKKNEGKKALYLSVAINCFAFVILVALSLLCTFSSVAASFCAYLAIKQQNFPEKQC